MSFPFLSSLLFPPAFKITSVAPAVSRSCEDAPRTRVRAVNDPHPPSLSILLSSIPFPLTLLSSILSLSLSVSRSTLPGVYIYIYIYIYVCVCVLRLDCRRCPFPCCGSSPDGPVQLLGSLWPWKKSMVAAGEAIIWYHIILYCNITGKGEQRRRGRLLCYNLKIVYIVKLYIVYISQATATTGATAETCRTCSGTLSL